jgi:multidrug efflux pump subunit AcrA (membrane-fusion protein)
MIFRPEAGPGIRIVRQERMIPNRTRVATLPLLMLLAAVAPAQTPVNRVVVKKAQEIDAPATIPVVGTVYPNRVSRVGSEVAGIVAEMAVRQGDAVEAGAVLCRLNGDTLRLRLDEERARLEALKARHEELLAGTRKEELERLRALRDEAVAEHDRWAFEMDRITRLFESKEANPKEYHDTRASFLAAERRKIAATASYDEAVAGPRKEVIARAAHDVGAQGAIVGRLESDLAKTAIRAPFSGYVTQRLVEVGEWIDDGEAVVELAELATVLVRVNAPESTFPYLKVGRSVRVRIDALDKTFDGTIRHVIPSADLTARTLPVEIQIGNDEGLMAAGMFARATIPSGPRRKAVAVPKDSVVQKDGVNYVAQVVSGQDGSPNGLLVPVTLGAEVEEWVAITSGNIQPDSPVITLGSERILPFPTPIEVVDELGRPVAMPDGKDKQPEQSAEKGGEGV